MGRGGFGAACLLPTLSLVGASLASPCFRFHNPLIEPNVRICRIRLLEKTHAIARTIKWIDLTGANLRRPSRNGE